MTQNIPYHKIKSLTVQGGFLDGININFDDNLNCIIGGRGTGKTTVLEFIRFAFNLMPDQEKFPEEYRGIEKLISHNLETGKIRLQIETKDGMTYFIEKTMSEDYVVTNEEGEKVNLYLETGDIFNAEIYSQNEIGKIADEPLYQLRLVDKFISQDIDKIEEAIRMIKHDLKQNANELSSLHKEIEDCQQQITRLPNLTEKLKAVKIETEGSDELKKESELKQLRDKEMDYLTDIKDIYEKLQKRLESFRIEIASNLIGCSQTQVLSGQNKDIFINLNDKINKNSVLAQEKLSEIIALFGQTGSFIDSLTSDVRLIHQEQHKKYQKLLEKHETEKDKIQEKDRLTKELNQLKNLKKKCDDRELALKERKKERQGLMNRLSELRDERYQKRLEIANMISNKLSPAIKVEIEQFGNTDAYWELLMDAMKGIGLRYTYIVDKVVQTISPQELASIVERPDVKTLAEQLELDEERAQRFILQLKGTEKLYEIETVDLYDKPLIQLKDGNQYKDSTSLSTGQKCAIILPILLLESESPLLIDQPEDNLDNTFMFETVVGNIRKMKGQRQLIFVTHNPNIPVLGEAEKVFVLQSDGKKAIVKAQGNVDKVKDHIETILEGGKEAFEERRKVYGH